MQQALQEQLLHAAKAMEDQLDSQMHAMDTLNEDDLEALRQQRLGQLKAQASRSLS